MFRWQSPHFIPWIVIVYRPFHWDTIYERSSLSLKQLSNYLFRPEEGDKKQICVKRMNLWQREQGSSGVHDRLHKFFSAVLLSSGRSRRHLSAPERKRTWAALQAELADRSGSCVGLSSAFGCFGSGGKTRHFYASRSFFPLNYVTVKTTFWRSQPTTWIPPIKVTLNKNKAIRHNTLDWYNCYNRVYVYGAM